MRIHADQLYKCAAAADGTPGPYMLRPISFEIPSGEHVLVTGASGSGKTTLLHLVAGLLEPTGGTLTMTEKQDGDPVSRADLPVSVMFQENRLLKELSAVRNIQVILPKEKDRAVEEARIREHLTGLLPGVDPDKPVAELSGGEKRRVALIRAVLAPGQVLLLDEPFTGLDETAVQAVREYIEAETEGRTVLLTDHEGTRFPEWRRIHCETISGISAE